MSVKDIILNNWTSPVSGELLHQYNLMKMGGESNYRYLRRVFTGMWNKSVEEEVLSILDGEWLEVITSFQSMSV